MIRPILRDPCSDHESDQAHPDEVRLVNWEAGGLLKPSVVEPILILSSFDVRLVRRTLGAPSASDLAQCSNRVPTSLNRESPACCCKNYVNQSFPDAR
jgi:hypothetical protein